jgi:hypothetical protein
MWMLHVDPGVAPVPGSFDDDNNTRPDKADWGLLADVSSEMDIGLDATGGVMGGSPV